MSAPFCATGGLLADLGGANACAAAATWPRFNAGAWSLLPAPGKEFPDPLALLLARLIPAESRRDAAAGFATIARCAAVVMAAPAAPAPAVADSCGASCAPPTRERRSGLEVKYLQGERARIGGAPHRQ